jgi:hypothetical protein
MIKKIQDPLGREMDRIAKESKRFMESDIDSMGRIARESERLRESDVDVPTKKPRAVRNWEKNGHGG